MSSILTVLSLALSIHIVSGLGFGIEQTVDTKTNVKKSFLMGLMILGVALIVTLLGFLIQWIIKPLNVSYLVPFIQILVSLGVVLGLKTVKQKLNPECDLVDQVFPAFILNSAVIVVGIVVLNQNVSIVDGLLQAIGLGIGYLIMLTLYAAIKGRLGNYHVNKRFEGLPLALITLGLIALTLSGLAGLF